MKYNKQYNIIKDLFQTSTEVSEEKSQEATDKFLGILQDSLKKAYKRSTTLDKKFRVAQLRYKDGMTYKDISEKEGVTSERVRQILNKDLVILRKNADVKHFYEQNFVNA